jgi:hypothetical protein
VATPIIAVGAVVIAWQQALIFDKSWCSTAMTDGSAVGKNAHVSK